MTGQTFHKVCKTILAFGDYNWINHGKRSHISTNMPGIGSLNCEIDVNISERKNVCFLRIINVRAVCVSISTHATLLHHKWLVFTKWYMKKSVYLYYEIVGEGRPLS